VRGSASGDTLPRMSADPTPAAEQPFILAQSDGGVVRLTLNRPERFNPLSSAMIAALQERLDGVAGDPEARVVVLSAGGRGFCAGHDLKEMRAHAAEEAWQRRLFDDCSRMMVSLTRLPQPVIARVHGIATAAGCQLVSMCDLAVAADTATFALPGVNIGVFCTTPAVGVGRNVARKRVMEMLLTGQPIDAPTALDWGLVNRVVPAAELDAAVQSFVDLILARSPAVIALGKRAFYDQIDRALTPAYDAAGDAMTRGVLLEDAAEGMDAFLQKRPPLWHGR
jgi:enoyl-CoA hydratase/carnithine racemase